MRLLLFVLIFWSINIHSQQQIRFVEISLKQALERAKIENKMVFIDAYAKWCRPCKQMDIEFKNPAVIEYFNKNFINVKVNVEEAYGLAYKQEYQIVFLPSLIFTDFNGKQRTKIDNVVSGNELLSVSKFINNKYGPSGEKNLAVSSDATPLNQKTQATPVKKKPETTIANNRTSDVEEKILYVMGDNNDNLPPQVLKQEAYFRMQLMDGSHNESAISYLNTQSDWLTEDNMRFIFDFIDDCKSELFNHVVDNRKNYEDVLGEKNVLTTLSILINKELDRAYPRPSKERAFRLYSIINNKKAEELSASYHLEGLYSKGNFKEFSKLGINHLEHFPFTNNTNLTYRICDKAIQTKRDKKSLRIIKEKLITLTSYDPKKELYYFSLAEVYLKLKNKQKASESINKAFSLCESKGTSIKKITELYEILNER